MSMYNKLFTKILDSSIWLESQATRLVWLTLIAAMDEHGFCQFASVANLAHRARVSLQEADEAIACLEGPDSNSSDPEHDGRRIERIPGGWIVLNAKKHRDMVTRAVIQEQTRARVQRFRDKKRTGNALVTPSEAISDTDTRAETAKSTDALRARFEAWWAVYPRKVGKGAAWALWARIRPSEALAAVMTTGVQVQSKSPQWTKEGGQFIPYPTTWLRQGRWEDETATVGESEAERSARRRAEMVEATRLREAAELRGR